MCEGRKELAQTTGRLQLILFSEITGAFLFRIFGGFLHVHTTQIYCRIGAIVSETHKIIITIYNTTRSSTKGNFSSMKYCCFFFLFCTFHENPVFSRGSPAQGVYLTASGGRPFASKQLSSSRSMGLCRCPKEELIKAIF